VTVAKRSSEKKPPREPSIFDYLRALWVDRLLLFGEYIADVDLTAVPPAVTTWLNALETFDAGDKSSLVNLMKSGYPLPNELLPHIGDLLERWDFKRPPHKMRLPSYRLTPDEIKWHATCNDVNDRLAAGRSLDDALAEVAEGRGVNVTTLREYHAKRRGRHRRANARIYDAKRRPRRK
jgi:hypothetical protein